MVDDLKQQIMANGQPLVLIGMMGTGKSHFGRMLSKALGLEYYDSDTLVEEKAGCAISEIFARWGEDNFRSVEAKTIKDCIDKGVCVISTGGGAILNADTAQNIFANTLSIWVDAPVDVILQRVKKNRNRPLLACENPADVLQELMQVRRPIYERARFKLESGVTDADSALRTVLKDIETYLRQNKTE
ncbi:MAG: shikimate kinase [Micavibrio sp.]|nr:shikimate kinase [Micavibrio sp.]